MDVLQYQLKSKAACFLIFSFRNANRTHLFSPVKTTFHAELCNPITCQAIELESCSNPLRIQQVLYSKSKKNFFVFGGGFSGGTPQVGVFLATFTWPWAPIYRAIIMAQDFFGN